MRCALEHIGAAASVLFVTAGLAGGTGCSHQPAPATPAAQASPELAAGEPGAAAGETPEPAPAADAADAVPADPAPGAPAGDPNEVTIEPAGGRAAEPKTLAEAAEAARARRGDRPKATTVITNENLAEWAAGAQVTLAPEPAGDSAAAAPADAEPASGDTGPGGPRDEVYWRERARELRTRWASAAEEIERLEKEAADLRWAFYAEDDPYYRDERIKPSWDRALDELRRARQDERYFRDQVEELMGEGRRAGALPGWLREGVELEPEDAGEPDAPIGREPRSTEPIEPPTGEERPR